MTIPDSESGHTFAEAAHQAGAVMPLDPQPTYQINLACLVHGTLGRANDVLEAITAVAVDLADNVTTTIQVRD